MDIDIYRRICYTQKRMNANRINSKGGRVISIFSWGKEKNAEPEIFRNGLRKAVAFVDYESWYVSMNVNYGLRPDIKGWYESLAKRVNLTEVVFFADFSHKSLASEIQRIRPFSNKIIDTRSPAGVQKDFTDFIILDNIYQKAMMSEGIDVFILFSGDGHFSSVVAFLKNICGKEVGVYAINGSFSRQLKETASWTETLPSEEELYGNIYSLIFDELKNAKTMLTVQSLTDSVAKTNKNLRKRDIDEVMDRLRKGGVLTTRTVGKTKNAVFVDWEKAKEFIKE